MPVYDNRIGAGHNLPLGSLANIETIQPTGDVNFYPPESYGNYDPGVAKYRTDAHVAFSGFNKTVWRWRGKITRKQARYLQDTYCGGGYSGDVTIYTELDNPGTYVRCNAVMNLTKLTGATKNFTVFTLYEATMNKIGTLP